MVEATNSRCRCQRSRRGRAHKKRRGEFYIPCDAHGAERTLPAPPSPLNEMPVYVNSAIGIPVVRVRSVRCVVRTAVANKRCGMDRFYALNQLPNTDFSVTSLMKTSRQGRRKQACRNFQEHRCSCQEITKVGQGLRNFGDLRLRAAHEVEAG